MLKVFNTFQNANSQLFVCIINYSHHGISRRKTVIKLYPKTKFHCEIHEWFYKMENLF